MRLSFALIAFAGSAQAQGLPERLDCDTHTRQSVVITQSISAEFGPLICFDAPGLNDLTACAPDQGWGLSFGTGTAALAAVTADPAVATAHPDGKFAVLVEADRITAAASFGPGLPDLAGNDDATVWRLSISLSEGFGTASTQSGPLMVTCD